MSDTARKVNRLDRPLEFKVNTWLVENASSLDGLTYAQAGIAATRALGFTVTGANMKSASNVTGATWKHPIVRNATRLSKDTATELRILRMVMAAIASLDTTAIRRRVEELELIKARSSNPPDED